MPDPPGRPQQQPGQPQPRASTPGGTASPAQRGSQQVQDLNRIVLDYLNKHGYTKTEAMFRVESSRTSSPMGNNVGPNGGVSTGVQPVSPAPSSHPKLYTKGYSALREWVNSSLELYRPELRRIMYPLFVHVFLELVSLNFSDDARDFFDTYAPDHEVLHGQDIENLAAISLPTHLTENELAKLYLGNKYRLYVSRTALDLVLYFLHEIETTGGAILIRILNQRTETHVTSLRPSLEGIEQSVNVNEGIGGVAGMSAEKFNAQAVKLGKMPVDSEFQKEVETELEKKDKEDVQKTKQQGNEPNENNELQQNKKANDKEKESLVDTFRTMIKEEDDSPAKDSIPLPKYKRADIDQEILKVVDMRASIRLGGTSSLAPMAGSVQTPLPSVCMYTFHNTHDNMNTVTFSDDSELIAGGFSDSIVKIWSTKGTHLKSVLRDDPYNSQPNGHGGVGASCRRLIGHSGPVYGMSFSPDNRYLVTSSEDKTVRLWSMDTYTALVSYKGHNHPVWDVAFSPLGHYFATASHDQTARLWSCDHIYPLRIFAGHLSDVDTVTFHPNGAYVFTGSSDKTIRMWDISSGNCVRVFMAHTAPINTLAISPDGRWMASAGEDATVNLWDIGSGKRLKCMRGHGRTSIYSVAFSRDGSVLISGGADCSVRVWDVRKETADAGSEPEPLNHEANGNSGLANGAGAAGGGAGGPGTGAVSGGVTGTGGGTPVGGATAANGGRKEIQATADHMAVFHTKRTPVYKVHFTRRNLCLTAGAFLG